MIYHKEIDFPLEHKEKLASFTARINALPFSFSSHAREQVRQRITSIEYFQAFFKAIQFKLEDVFEYVYFNNAIQKAVYRVSYNQDKDIIFSIAENKKIITLYLNNKGDNHFTLRKEKYLPSLDKK